MMEGNLQWFIALLILAVLGQIVAVWVNSPREIAKEFRAALEQMRRDHGILAERYAGHDVAINGLAESVRGFREETKKFSEQVSELRTVIAGFTNAAKNTRRR